MRPYLAVVDELYNVPRFAIIVNIVKVYDRRKFHDFYVQVLMYFRTLVHATLKASLKVPHALQSKFPPINLHRCIENNILKRK